MKATILYWYWLPAIRFIVVVLLGSMLLARHFHISAWIGIGAGLLAIFITRLIGEWEDDRSEGFNNPNNSN
jgi:hypothetical protein